MEPSRHYSQPGMSTQYAQQPQPDSTRGSQMQVIPVGNRAVQQYINRLYHNPTQMQAGSSNDPGFYAKAHKDMVEMKHKLEQMILANQQHAEIANVSNQIPHPQPSYPHYHPYAGPQGAVPHQHGAWTGPTPAPWPYQQQPVHQHQTYPQQTYPQPMAQSFVGQYAPGMAMQDGAHQQAQPVPQANQSNLQSHHSVPYQQPQPGLHHPYGNPQPAQQSTASFPNATHQPQRQPVVQQATPSTSASYVQNAHQPQAQPQHPTPAHSQMPDHPQGNPLQPGHQPNQAGGSNIQKDREIAQKQLQYLQHLAQQHKRRQQSRPSSHQSSPASPQVALPTLPPAQNASGSALSQLAHQLQAPVQRSSSPQEEPPVSASQVQDSDTVGPSPARIRSRKPFSLHDLKPERRQSTGWSVGSNASSRTADSQANGSINPTHNESVPSPNLSNSTSSAQTGGASAGPASLRVDIPPEVPSAPSPVPDKPARPAPTSKQSGAGMKLALERLHGLGVDCVALVRQAAKTVGIPVDSLQETGPGDPSIPLFATGQPLDVWTSNLRVNKTQGDNLVNAIWALMKERMPEKGIDAATFTKGSPNATTNTTPIEKEQPANYGNAIPPVDDVKPTAIPVDSAKPETGQHTTLTEQSQTKPKTSHLSNESHRPSTAVPNQAPPVQTPSAPKPPTAPNSIPTPQQTAPRPKPMQHNPQAAPVSTGVPTWQVNRAQLAQKYQYSPYPNSGTNAALPVAGSSTSSTSATRVGKPKNKPRKTAALDYLRSIGIDISDGGGSEKSESTSNESPAQGEPIQTKDKGKGKATDSEEPVVLVQPGSELESQSKPDNNGNVVSESVPPAVNAAEPSRVLEAPPSPVAPIITVLPEPSPTPPSPLSAMETTNRPMTPIPQVTPVIHAPTHVSPVTATPDDLNAPVDDPSSLPATSAPVMNSPSSVPDVPAENADPARPVSQALADLSSPIATPLKRKREPRVSDSSEAGPGPNTEARARQHTSANKHDQKRPKVTKRDSTTTGVGKKPPSQVESPYPNIPLPADPPPNNSWAQSYASAMNSANRMDRPLFRPETPPADELSLSPRSKPKPAKPRMIMEVVIPVPKKKRKAVADLTSDTGTERDDDLGLSALVDTIHDDTRTEQEPDLKLIRRRLRPHTCEWIGCIGPPVLSSVELLGVHLNRRHLNCRDSDTFIRRATICVVGVFACFSSRTQDDYGVIFRKSTSGILFTAHMKANCDRTTSERYRMIVHVNRAHRGNPEAKLRVFAQPEDFPPGRVESEERVVLRPDAFPDGVPYFRIMAMALRYEVVPAHIPSQRHARIGPIVLRNISAPTGIVSVPRPVAGGRVPELPLPTALSSPMPRSQVRLGTVPPDALGEEIEREVGPPPNRSPVRRMSNAKGTKAAGDSSTILRTNPSPARSYITITSNESSPEPKSRTGSTVQAPGHGRGRGGTSTVRANQSMVSQSSQTSIPPKAPRLQLVVELPGRGRGGSTPAYVSARSADEILSSIRPTRIKSESLRSLNIFLDELLWLILHSARSLATNRLKAGLLQIMPGTVGKDAILEAEVELRAYRQRSPSLGPEEQGLKQAEFPLQPTFELLRQKCEAYCTLGDLEENVVVESALQEKMLGGGPCAPKVEQIAPAALYLTAILEHICEHVLNNVGQVVARDSSRGTAYSLDVYTALCEDATIYPLFKTMKVHEQIEAQSRAFRPSHRGSSSISGGIRTRSISRVKPDEDLGPARKMSIPTSPSAMPTASSPTNTSSSLFSRRPSADVVLTTGVPAQSSSSKSSLERTRTSLERITGKKSMERSNSTRVGDKSGRGIKLFGKGSRHSSEDVPSNHMAPFPSISVKELPTEQSAASQSGGTRQGTVFEQGPNRESDAGDESDGPYAQDFDELMRSGATMKVSLTPDRLKTFEVFSKQKKSRGQLPDNSPPPPLPTPRSPDSTAMSPVPRISSAPATLAPQFLSEEPSIPAVVVPAVPAVPGRSRSHTESGSTRPSIGTKPSNGPGLLRKASFNGSSRTRSGSDTTPPNEPSVRTRKVSEAPKLATMAASPVRKRGPARRRESMDLDDIINEPITPRRGGGGSGGALVAKPAHQTANTRDLIDFLSEGPPGPSPHIARSASQGTIDPVGPAVKPKQSGSGSSWFKRLVGGSSTSNGERSIPVPDVPEPASATRILGKQRSEKNLRGTSTSGLAAYGKVPPSPALSVDTGLHANPSLTLGRRASPNRKARDVFGAQQSTPEPARSLSPASSKPSLRRVPVPKLDDDTSSRADVSEHGLQLIPEPISVPKAPETGLSKPERRRPGKIQDPSFASTKVQDKLRETIRPTSPIANITASQAAELRAAIAHATSADECRMLLDLVLGQWGVGRHDPEPSSVPPLSAGCSDFDDTDEAMAVDMLLGEGNLKRERQWPLTPKDSHPKLYEARVAASLRSAE
ncbi:hypothetical protein RHS01_01949 [Rhizoctonia solani]|uniref:Titin n=1 Tax=Rhizoctonia solani TaxID=456999 RepID=A0A8H7IJB3_9AGAM|nr:hypothetical protein RHS01_01949 [Rhizoctonia solani]